MSIKREDPPTCKENMEDRRERGRFSTELKAQYRLKDEEEDWKECTIIDISIIGMGINFLTGEKINVGSAVHLRISIPDNLTVNGKGILKWMKQRNNDLIGGIEITELTR